MASHPNLAKFWNRDEVYRLIGFEQFWSAEHLDGRNAMGRLMSDAELFRQVKEKLTAENDPRPLFDYMVTIDGHWNYRQPEGQPQPITSHSAVADIGNFANTMYFKSRDAMNVIEALRREDPDAVIVAFGDHLPLLGSGFEGYAESGLLPETYGEFTAANYDFSNRTPLIMIDGRNGPLKLGALPMYDLPRLIARLLGVSDVGILELARAPADVTPRPLPQADLAYRGGEVQELCLTPEQSPVCARIEGWLRDVKLLNHDLFRGNQHVLKLLGSGMASAHATP